MSSNKVIVVGGGPAGLLAAGRAAQSGAEVLLLEKGPKLGRKLNISGKGRCNITNTADLPEFIEAFEPKGKFLYGVFSRFFRDDLIDLLHSLGVQTKVERGGRVFPVSDKASDVTNALEKWAVDCGVGVRLNTRAKSIDVVDGRVTGVRIYGGRMDAAAVIVATGGASYPKTGSTGDGYDLAREVGHTIVSPTPALSALVTHEDWVPNLQGLSLKNVTATLLVEQCAADGPGFQIPDHRGCEGAKVPEAGGLPSHLHTFSHSHSRKASEFGEMLFTHFGVSGPIILTISRGVDALLAKGKVAVSIDLKPALSDEELHARFIRDFKSTRHFANYLQGLLPRLMIGTFVLLLGIDPNKPVNTITAQERGRIVELLKDFRVTVARMAPLEEAIVTSGGVPIGEIDSRTMMSKIASGLFFAGEVIDIDAKTGGFNLQAALSTGWVAGESAGEYTISD